MSDGKLMCSACNERHDGEHECPEAPEGFSEEGDVDG